MNAFLLIFPPGGSLNKGPSWVDEMETPETARDLTKAIQALGEQYRIAEFEEEFNALAKSFGATSGSLKRGEYNPLILLEEGLKDDYKKFMKALEGLDRKYSFQDFHDRCVYLRSTFDGKRKGYLYDSVLTQCVPIMFFFPPEIADQFFQDWLDGVIQQEKSLLFEYENLDGETVRLAVEHKADAVTQDYVECRPIDRFAGDTPYDAFLVRYFWNAKLGWVPVPIHLIKRYAINR